MNLELIIEGKALGRAGIIRDDYPDSPLAPLAGLVYGNLGVIGSAPARDLLEFYLKEEILGAKKTR